MRLLMPGDESQVEYLVGLHTLHSQSHIPFHVETLRETMRDSITTGEPISWVVERDDGLILGFSLASLTGYRWSNALQCRLEVIYVHPDARKGSSIGVALFLEYDRWTRTVGAVESHCGVIHGIKADVTARWMRRFGFEEVGTYLRKVL